MTTKKFLPVLSLLLLTVFSTQVFAVLTGLPRVTGIASDASGTNSAVAVGVTQANMNFLSPAGAWHSQAHSHWHADPFNIPFPHNTAHAGRHIAGASGYAIAVADPHIGSPPPGPDTDESILDPIMGPIGSGPALSADGNVEMEYFPAMQEIEIRVESFGYLEARILSPDEFVRLTVRIPELSVEEYVHYNGASVVTGGSLSLFSSATASNGIVNLDGLSASVPFSGTRRSFNT